ncbi:MAG: methyltransferase domain-containing protein [Rhodospirillaceae bacterium]|nr:methyltransferase domain-containing protein [Rhodospirillaceae bacterium]
MTKAKAYPLDRSDREFKRLRIQAEALAAESDVMLQRIGVGSGWNCLDIGCGVGGITDLLSARVGPSGQVLGVDLDESSLVAARGWAEGLNLDNVSFQQANVLALDLPAESFDLVHMRYVVTTIRHYEEVIRNAYALVKPGGWLVLEESDSEGLHCYPEHPAWYRLKTLLQDVFDAVGADTRAGRRCWPIMRALGLEGLSFRPCQAGCRSGDDLVDYLPQTIISSRRFVAEHGLMEDAELDRLIADCRAHLADLDTLSTNVTLVQIWGRKPE